MAQPRAHQRSRRLIVTLAPMLASIAGVAAIVGALAFYVFPADADNNSSVPKGTKIAVPTQPAAEEPDPTEPPAEPIEDAPDAELAERMPTETAITVEPTS